MIRDVKVALVSEWLDAWRGGAETSTLQFMHHLMDAGVDLHVFTRSRPSPCPGLKVHTVNGAAMSRTRQSVTFSHRVERAVRSQDFDIVHAISPCTFADLYQPRGGTVAETIRRNVAIRQTSAAKVWKQCMVRLNLKQRYMLAVERRIFSNPSGPDIISISDYVSKQLREHYGVHADRIHKIYNGVDPNLANQNERKHDRDEIRSEFGIDSEDCLVILTAHNFRLKGVERWLETLSLLVREGVTGIKSLIIGKGESAHWHRLAIKLGVEHLATFTGPSLRMPAFRHAADVVIHPTYYDPCSRVVLEALVCGLPVITTQWDGASEMIEDGVNGYVVDDPGDIRVLANRVKLLMDAARRQAMGAAALNVTDKVSMARHTRAILALYDQMLTSRPGHL